MTPGWKGLFRRQLWILLLCSICDTYSIGYEPVDVQMNWSSAALQYTEDSELLARISNVHELCDAQTALTTVDAQYWTALKSDSSGNFHWGLLNTTAILDPAELLDDTQPGHCYVISASSMKLVAMDCNSLQGVLTTYNDDQEDNSNSSLQNYYSDECRQYKLSSCFNVSIDDSKWKSLPHSWSCKIVSGASIGNCQVEMTSSDCCNKYCHSGNRTYFIDIRADLSVKMRKVPKGFPRDVDIAFDTSDRVTLTSKAFYDSERVVVVTLHRTIDGGSSRTLENNDTLLSDVIGVELSPPYKRMTPNLVIIHFSHAKVPQGDVERKCVFWKEDVRISNGSWSRDGCSVLDASSLERTVCSCNHLTNFAVLMQFRPVNYEISKVHVVSLSVITYIGCALSLTGEALVVFIYVVFMKFKAEGIQIRINLAAALFFAQVVFLSGINATENKLACVFVAVLLHYFYLASFGWMLLEGVFLYIMVVEVFSTFSLRYLYLFAWGYPIIPVTISLVIGSKDDRGLQNYTNKHFCWLSFSKHLSWSFIVPVLVITIINVVILIAVLREIRNLQEPNPSTLKTFKKGLKACVILSPLLGLTWMFGLLTVIDAGLAFQYLFTIFNSTQGMAIFLLHVVRNSDVRAAFHHKLLKWRFDRLPISSANRVHEDASQSTSKRKRQHNPEDSKNELQNTQTGEQVTFTLQVPSPRIG